MADLRQALAIGVAGLMLAAVSAAEPAPGATPPNKPDATAKEPVAPSAPDSAKAEDAKPKVDPDQERKDALEKARREAEAAAKVPVLSYTMKTIDGQERPLSEYKGKVLLIVNTASRCGFTAQYTGLEQLYQAKKDQGFEILAFPANNFGGQEPGTDKEIKTFCTGEDSKYKITFPLFAKISVTGEDQDPLFKTLSAQPSPIGGDPKWNFTKFLVDRDGKVVARFESRIRPDDAELVRKLNQLLDQKGSESSAEQKPTSEGMGEGSNPSGEARTGG